MFASPAQIGRLASLLRRSLARHFGKAAVQSGHWSHQFAHCSGIRTDHGSTLSARPSAYSSG